jgi:hypothetical protein
VLFVVQQKTYWKHKVHETVVASKSSHYPHKDTAKIIIDEIGGKGGRFLKKDHNTGYWGQKSK